MKLQGLCGLMFPLGLVIGGTVLACNGVSILGTAYETSQEQAVATDTTEISTATDTTVLSGTWQETENGRQYVYTDGSYATGITEIDGVAYLFDYQGTQKTGWQTVNGVRQYYDPETGEVVTGWISYKDRRYYSKEETGRQTGIITEDDFTYLLNDTYGYQETGWQQIDDARYYYDADSGEAAVGVTEIEGSSYLFDYTGAQKTGWRTVNGTRWYYDDGSGELVTGWVWYDGYRYYVDEENGKQTGEVIVDDVHYMLDSTYGQQKLGFQTFSDGVVSYYKADGTAVTGWQTISNNKYYFNANGVMQTGWKTISGNKYYFNSSGVMQTGWKTISGSKYYFNSSGVMQTGLQTISGSKYYFDSSGVMQTGWKTISGSKYYFDSSGVMQTGWQMISSKLYYFNSSGVMQKSKTVWLKTYQYTDYGYYYGKYYLQSNGVAIPYTDYLLNTATRSGTKNKITVYNRQTSTTTTWTNYLTDRDIQILKNFASAHFTSDMTMAEKLKVTWEWIHYNVDYAYSGTSDWDTITNLTYVEAVFSYRLGQCLQYNGAMAAMMAYFGYDVNLVQGYVYGGQHFWTKVHINGVTYLMETGNYGKNGEWGYFMGTYEYAGEYVQY